MYVSLYNPPSFVMSGHFYGPCFVFSMQGQAHVESVRFYHMSRVFWHRTDYLRHWFGLPCAVRRQPSGDAGKQSLSLAIDYFNESHVLAGLPSGKVGAVLERGAREGGEIFHSRHGMLLLDREVVSNDITWGQVCQLQAWLHPGRLTYAWSARAGSAASAGVAMAAKK